MSDPYTLYYIRQAEGHYHGGPYGATGQKGLGLGSFLGNWIRRLFPLLRSGAKAVGSEAVSTGFNVLRDFINGKPLKDSVGDRINEAGQNLSKKASTKLKTMMGSGYNRSKRKRKRQSTSVAKRRKISKKGARKKKRKPSKKKQRVLDIFT